MATNTWLESFTVTFRVMRVNRINGLETGVIDCVVSGGSIDRNQGTSIKESASLTVLGRTEFGVDRVRVWADITFFDGATQSVPLGTFTPNVPKRVIDGVESEQSVSLYGLLREAADDMFENPITVAKGVNAVDKAAEILRSCKLTVLPYEHSDYKLAQNWLFGYHSSGKDEKNKRSLRNGSKLDAVNALLDLAGFNSARTNEMGEVILEPYVEPADRPTVWEFIEGDTARFVQSMTEERDLMDVPNVVKATYYTMEKEFTGIAVNDNPASEFSTVARGRRVCKAYVYSNLPEGLSDAKCQKKAQAKAQELLQGNMSVVHRVTFQHVFAPTQLTQALTLVFPTGGVDGRFVVWSQQIKLEPGIPVTCVVRNFDRDFVDDDGKEE